jgi:hypothetical protein
MADDLREPDDQSLWSMAWETLRLHAPDLCAELESHRLVTDEPA